MAATRDQKILFTALGFTAVIMSGAPKDKQAQRALAIAQLIEDFCMDAVGEEVEPASVQADLFSGLINDNHKNQNAMQGAVASLRDFLEDDADETPVTAASIVREQP